MLVGASTCGYLWSQLMMGGHESASESSPQPVRTPIRLVFALMTVIPIPPVLYGLSQQPP
jgi:hypothetical protein